MRILKELLSRSSLSGSRAEPSRLLPHLAVAVDEVLVGGEGGETHGASGVKLLGGDADLGAKSELATVGEAS